MSSKDIAIKVEKISKRYRIGLKEQMLDSLGGAIFDFVRSPLKNYRKYRSLYTFGDSDSDSGSNSADIIWALRNVSFTVERGEVLGIIGLNGAGKSTLLKILARITEPTTGRAEIHGRVSSLLEVGTGFHPELTGRENIYLNGTILGMRKKEIDRRFDEIIDFSGVEKFIDTPVKRYSSGMRVRVAFAVAAYLEPEILIIDEVLAVGDARFQKKCLNKMQNVGEEGRTVLFVSHNMLAIARLCHRTIILDQGRVLADGPTSKVIGIYLRSGTGTMAVKEWEHHPNQGPGNEMARLLAVRVRSEDGQVREDIDIRRSVRLEMEYKVSSPGHILMPYFQFYNSEGICIFTSFDLEAAGRKKTRPEGRYKSIVNIPGNFWAEGMVFVEACINTINPWKVQISVPDVVAFQVIDTMEGDSVRGDYAGNLPGIVRPIFRWSTDFTPD